MFLAKHAKKWKPVISAQVISISTKTDNKTSPESESIRERKMLNSRILSRKWAGTLKMASLKSYSFWSKRLNYMGNFSVMTRDIMSVVRQGIFAPVAE